MNHFGWAVVGPGKIAHRFAEAVCRMPETALVSVLGRDAGRSGEFARKWSGPRGAVEVADSIETILRDGRVHGVYIATPHAFHADAMRRCLAAGKPVLCEKPLVPNHAAAVDMVELARRNQVFLMEAVWTRFLPVWAEVTAWLRSGAIGRVRAIQSSFCFEAPFDAASRAFDPLQAGGALLDIGIYNLTMTRWALQAAYGACPPLVALQANGTVGPTGVDHRIAGKLEFADGVSSQFLCAFDMSSDNSFRITGENGAILLPKNFWQATDAELRVFGADAVTVNRPFAINGFEGEIQEAVDLIRAGKIESPSIPHDETLVTLEWMDRIRAIVGVRYPFEEAAAATGVLVSPE